MNQAMGINVPRIYAKSRAASANQILAEMDRQKKTAERQYAPISEFVLTLNQFLRESRKVATVDSLGRLTISSMDDQINLRCYHLVEKQLIILLAHAKFIAPHEASLLAR
ncbi:MAG: hypothetical protein IPN04_08345 [Rhodoferax sp.]|nr:hypothetical protein [Rhodoferax sp.]